MYPQIEIKHNIGNTIKIPNQIDSRAFTYTTTTTATGVTAIPVDNGNDFTSGSTILLLLSTFGAENAEFVTSASHSNTSFTTSATTQQHNRGEKIQQVKWDQINIFKSSTIGGTYTILGTSRTIQATQLNTIIDDSTGLTTDYYKVQWKNSITSEVSDFSEPISVLAYPTNSVGVLLKSVTTMFGISENDKSITPEFLIEVLNDAREYTESKLYGIRHAWRQEFDHKIKVLAGRNYVPLPDDIDFNETDRSVLAARFLTNNIMSPYNLLKIDKRSWNQMGFYSTGGICQTLANIGETTITLDSVGDFFPQGGSAQVATDLYTQTVMEIEYTGLDYATNQLTGVTGVTRAIPVDAQIWSRASLSQPMYYTVFENRMYFTSLIPDSMQGNNLYLDYYKKLVKVTNLYDELPEHYRELYKPYLRWAIKYRKDITLPTSDPDLVKFYELVESLFSNLYSGQDTVIVTS